MGLKSILGGSKKQASAKRAPLRNESLREDPAAEPKRVARQRLVGSVALLLIAIIVLPLVLEDAPKPVAPDIALQIPSRDLAVRSQPDADPPRDPLGDGKAGTATRPSDKSAEKPSEKSADRSNAKAVADKPAEKLAELTTDKPVDVKTDSKPADSKPELRSEAKADPKPEPRVVPKPEQKTEPRSEPRAEAKVAAKPEPKAEPKAGKHLNVVQGEDPIAGFADQKSDARTPDKKVSTASPALGAAPAASSSTGTVSSGRTNHWVQIGAFGNEAKAREMASQLRGKGYPAVTEVVRGGNGELYRVRVGPLETRESAGRARDNLAKSGFEGSVVQ